MLLLYASLVSQSFKEAWSSDAANFIAGLNVKIYVSSLSLIPSRPSWTPRHSEVSYFGNSACESRETSIGSTCERPLSQASRVELVTVFEDEDSSVRTIRHAWLDYFNAQGIARLSYLMDLYLAYQQLGVEPVAIRSLFLKEVSQYGDMSVISTEAVDGVVIQKAKLPKKYLGLSSTWPDLQLLCQTLSRHDASKKPFMLISVSDNQQEMERLVSFPEGSDRFALDIAVSIFDDHLRLARHMLTVCQINSDVLSKLRALEEDINPEIRRALYDLARKDPKDFLMITPPYIELASLVYKRSLTLNMNLMLTRAFYKDSPAPADYFITETSDRLIALCFMAVIC